MKCLVDEALPRSLARALKDAGIDAVDARDVGTAGKRDSEVLACAVSHGRSLLTKDLDFADPRRFPPEGHFGILIVRFPDSISKAALVRMVVDAVKTVKDEEAARNIVIIEPTNLRFWHKPSGSPP